jgi:signal transduction histidine kinase
MHELVEDTLSLVRTVFRHDRVRLRVDVPEDLPEVSCRIQRIQQALMSLLNNAREAIHRRPAESASDRDIRICAEPHWHSGQRWVRLTVEDRGVGIAPEHRDRVFEPFFTMDRGRHAGLGLPVSYAIVREHGGLLSVESEQGAWTRFHVDLPAAAAGRQTPRHALS